MTYEELWAAQVRARALVKHDVYRALQDEIKSRTQLGHVSGFVKIPNRGHVWPYRKNGINYDSPHISVRVHNRDEEGIRIVYWTHR